MAVRVGEGEHTVRFDYTTPGLLVGACISIMAAVALTVYLVLFNRAKKANPEKFAVTNVERYALMTEGARQDAAETAYTGEAVADEDIDLTAKAIGMIKNLFAKKPKPTEQKTEEE